MSARERVQLHNGARVTATAHCQWERAPQGGLRATWRPGWRVALRADAGEHTPEPAARLTRENQHAHAVSRSAATAQQRPIDRWIAGGFIAALYLLIVFVEIAIVVRA